jgi:transketolase
MKKYSKELLKEARLRLLRMHHESGVGHIGGNLSCLPFLLYLYHNILGKHDQFVLSKGHSAGALYVALWSIGKLGDNDLKTFHKDNTKLAGHPSPNFIPEIPFATGSLGHGLGLSCGLALAKKLKNENGTIFCLTSDGEWQEGSNWESLIFLNHHNLDNLTLVVDCNGLQGFGSTEEIASMNLEKIKNIFNNFNLEVEVIENVEDAKFQNLISQKTSKPKVFILKTIKGSGVSFMKNKMEWHYLPLTKELYETAIKEVQEGL